MESHKSPWFQSPPTRINFLKLGWCLWPPWLGISGSFQRHGATPSLHPFGDDWGSSMKKRSPPLSCFRCENNGLIYGLIYGLYIYICIYIYIWILHFPPFWKTSIYIPFIDSPVVVDRFPPCSAKFQVFQSQQDLVCGLLYQLNRQKSMLLRDQLVQVATQ